MSFFFFSCDLRKEKKMDEVQESQADVFNKYWKKSRNNTFKLRKEYDFNDIQEVLNENKSYKFPKYLQIYKSKVKSSIQDPYDIFVKKIDKQTLKKFPNSFKNPYKVKKKKILYKIGNYHIYDITLGFGDDGHVCLAKHIPSGIFVAAKMLRTNLSDIKYNYEIKALKSLNRLYSLFIYNYDNTTVFQTIFFITHFIPGCTPTNFDQDHFRSHSNRKISGRTIYFERKDHRLIATALIESILNELEYLCKCGTTLHDDNDGNFILNYKLKKFVTIDFGMPYKNHDTLKSETEDSFIMKNYLWLLPYCFGFYKFMDLIRKDIITGPLPIINFLKDLYKIKNINLFQARKIFDKYRYNIESCYSTVEYFDRRLNFKPRIYSSSEVLSYKNFKKNKNSINSLNIGPLLKKTLCKNQNIKYLDFSFSDLNDDLFFEIIKIFTDHNLNQKYCLNFCWNNITGNGLYKIEKIIKKVNHKIAWNLYKNIIHPDDYMDFTNLYNILGLHNHYYYDFIGGTDNPQKLGYWDSWSTRIIN